MAKRRRPLYMKPSQVKARSGTGVIKRFRGDPDGIFIGIDRHGLGESILACDPDLAKRLLAKYGTKTPERPTFTNMSNIIGCPCRWSESGHGLWTDIEVLKE